MLQNYEPLMVGLQHRKSETFSKVEHFVNEKPFHCKIINWMDVANLWEEDFSFESVNKEMILKSLMEVTGCTNYDWKTCDISQLEKANMIVAADCVYDETLTTSLFKTIFSICLLSNSNEITIIFGVEKRLNFTLSDMCIASPCYDHFIKLLESLQTEPWNSLGTFIFHQEKDDFEQFLVYERSKYLELWKVNFVRHKEI
uniref:Uncharacterized protein n=1 Tax=Clytia hemisphaerica TaxID=252671 RepID=A0A7M5VB02_9CNID